MEGWIWAQGDGGISYGVGNPIVYSEYATGAIPHGSQYGYVNNTGSLTSAASLATVAADTLYTLNVDLGNHLDGGGYATNSTYTLRLLVDDVSVASLDVMGSTISLGDFDDTSLVWNSGATSTGDLKIQLETQLTSGGFSQANFDNVRLTAVAVPEPSSVLSACSCFCAAAAIDRYHPVSHTVRSTPLAWKTGQRVPLRLEFSASDVTTPHLHLFLESRTQDREHVPATALYPTK